MAAIAGGALALVGGGLAAANAPSAPNIKGISPRQAIFLPQLFAFLQAGGDISSLVAKKVPKGTKPGFARSRTADTFLGPLEGQYFGGDKKTGRYKRGWYLEDGTRVGKDQTVKYGKHRVLISGDRVQEAFQETFDAAQKREVEQTQANFDLLFGENGPQFLKDRITNRPDQIREAYGPAVSKGIREAIGGAAPAGTLTTDAILQRVSAPVAFQAESMFQQAEDVRNAQQLGLSGVPGFGQGFNSNPNNYLTPQSRDGLQGLNLSAYQAGYPSSLANAQGRFATQANQSSLLAGLFGGLGGIFGQSGGGVGN